MMIMVLPEGRGSGKGNFVLVVNKNCNTIGGSMTEDLREINEGILQEIEANLKRSSGLIEGLKLEQERGMEKLIELNGLLTLGRKKIKKLVDAEIHHMIKDMGR